MFLRVLIFFLIGQFSNLFASEASDIKFIKKIINNKAEHRLVLTTGKSEYSILAPKGATIVSYDGDLIYLLSPKSKMLHIISKEDIISTKKKLGLTRYGKISLEGLFENKKILGFTTQKSDEISVLHISSESNEADKINLDTFILEKSEKLSNKINFIIDSFDKNKSNLDYPFITALKTNTKSLSIYGDGPIATTIDPDTGIALLISFSLKEGLIMEYDVSNPLAIQKNQAYKTEFSPDFKSPKIVNYGLPHSTFKLTDTSIESFFSLRKLRLQTPLYKNYLLNTWSKDSIGNNWVSSFLTIGFIKKLTTFLSKELAPNLSNYDSIIEQSELRYMELNLDPNLDNFYEYALKYDFLSQEEVDNLIKERNQIKDRGSNKFKLFAICGGLFFYFDYKASKFIGKNEKNKLIKYIFNVTKKQSTSIAQKLSKIKFLDKGMLKFKYVKDKLAHHINKNSSQAINSFSKEEFTRNLVIVSSINHFINSKKSPWDKNFLKTDNIKFKEIFNILNFSGLKQFLNNGKIDITKLRPKNISDIKNFIVLSELIYFEKKNPLPNRYDEVKNWYEKFIETNKSKTSSLIKNMPINLIAQSQRGTNRLTAKDIDYRKDKELFLTVLSEIKKNIKILPLINTKNENSFLLRRKDISSDQISNRNINSLISEASTINFMISDLLSKITKGQKSITNINSFINYITLVDTVLIADSFLFRGKISRKMIRSKDVSSWTNFFLRKTSQLWIAGSIPGIIWLEDQKSTNQMIQSNNLNLLKELQQSLFNITQSLIFESSKKNIIKLNSESLSTIEDYLANITAKKESIFDFLIKTKESNDSVRNSFFNTSYYVVKEAGFWSAITSSGVITADYFLINQAKSKLQKITKKIAPPLLKVSILSYLYSKNKINQNEDYILLTAYDYIHLHNLYINASIEEKILQSFIINFKKSGHSSAIFLEEIDDIYSKIISSEKMKDLDKTKNILTDILIDKMEESK